MSEDPIGFLGGDTNLYRYVGNQPLIFRDPYGLDWQDSVGAVGDFYKNYSDMRDKNVKNSDKYFHCMANCQASSRGPDGLSMAQNLSNLRESFDENIKGDSSQACYLPPNGHHFLALNSHPSSPVKNWSFSHSVTV